MKDLAVHYRSMLSTAFEIVLILIIRTRNSRGIYLPWRGNFYSDCNQSFGQQSVGDCAAVSADREIQIPRFILLFDDRI